MPNQVNFHSLKDWCIKNNDFRLMNVWDYEKNEETPDTIGHISTRYVWLKCPNLLHESTNVVLQSVVKAYVKGKDYKYCKSCNSIGKYIIDNYGEDYLNKIWSIKNESSPYEIAKRSLKNIWLKCLDDNTHPDYDFQASNFVNSHKCPYCSGKRVCETNSFGYLYNDYLDLWSDKNELGPFDYTYGSNAEIWFKCPDGIHDDYRRKLCNTILYDFRCPECSRIAQWGPYYKNTNRELNHKKYINTIERYSPEIRKWRKNALKRDYNICQCCGSGEGINVHHIVNFAQNIELRADNSNSICLCNNCHSMMVKGSFYNIYGTINNNAEQLEEYINNKRKELGIPIPFSIDSYKEGNVLTPGDVEWAKEFYKSSNNQSNHWQRTSDNNFIMIKPKFRIDKED